MNSKLKQSKYANRYQNLTQRLEAYGKKYPELNCFVPTGKPDEIKCTSCFAIIHFMNLTTIRNHVSRQAH